MTDVEFEEFHGTRDKHGLEHFFDEGCKVQNEAIPGENPYWKDTKEMYYKRPHKLQKTVRMTAVFYTELKAKHKTLFYSPTTGRAGAATIVEADRSGSSDDFEDPEIRLSLKQRILRKRKSEGPIDETMQNGQTKGFKRSRLEWTGEKSNANLATESEGKIDDLKPTRQKKHKSHNEIPEHDSAETKEKLDSKQKNFDQTADGQLEFCDTKPKKFHKQKASCDRNISDLEDLTCDIEPPTGPLLQLPTGSGKVYTRLSADHTQVWKGPYKPERMNLVLFFHKVMKEVLEDPHTLDIEQRGPYLIFPLLKGSNVTEIKVTKQDYRDAISKTDVKDGDFVLRESLGVIQLHRIGVGNLKKLPASLLAHFMWRFALNVGDSGLYNAITDHQMSFLYGIDMEEYRGSLKDHSLVGYVDLLFLVVMDIFL